MPELVSTLLEWIERDFRRSGSAHLEPAKGRLAEKMAKACGHKLPPGVQAWVSRWDGGTLGQGLKLLSFDEAQERRGKQGSGAELKGLWPVLEEGGRLFALDTEYPGIEGEWPVVEVFDRSVDRAGSTLLRFLYAVAGELLLTEAEDIDRARELCRRDPGYSEYWVDLADLLDQAGLGEETERALAEGIVMAAPAGPALPLGLALRAWDRDDRPAARASLEDALSLEPLTARDDDARLDAAAVSLALAEDWKDLEGARKARDLLGQAATSTGAFWRGEAVRALVGPPGPRPRRARLALRVVELLIPGDLDVPRLRDSSPALLSGLRNFVKAREALDRGELDEALRLARAAVAEATDIGICHALLAECCNAKRERGGLEAARRATELNPAVAEGWRELGDAYLDSRQAAKAEEAYREIVKRDPTSGMGLAKLGQALLELGRSREALEAVDQAAERGGDPFLVAAVRGDVYSEMNRHRDAAACYDEALRIDPEDHWTLHQAALEWGRAGELDRASELFEQAIKHDQDGCHQTFVDYADLLRRMGRIGDAVRFYRKAVAAVPNEPDWRQSLRDAEKELQAAPN
jgi:tetratricopeptide (TPR) repeat protein